MRVRLIILYASLFIATFACRPSGPPTSLSKESIIPKPVSIASTGSSFKLDDDAEIYVSDDSLISIGQYLSDRLTTSTGFALPVKISKRSSWLREYLCYPTQRRPARPGRICINYH